MTKGLWLEYWGEVRQEDSLGVNPCKRKQQSGEKEKKQNAKQVRERNKKVCLSGQGRRETEGSEGWLTVTNAVQKSKRMRTKISIGFSKKCYNDLGKHGFSRLLPMTIYHKVSHRADHEDNDNWLLYTWQHKGEKQAIQRKDGGMNAYFWVLFIMQALSVFWKNMPTVMRSSKTISILPGKGTKACRMLTENGIPLSELLSSSWAWCAEFRPQPFLVPLLSCKQHHQLNMK